VKLGYWCVLVWSWGGTNETKQVFLISYACIL
jgi:hypothetical protein